MTGMGLTPKQAKVLAVIKRWLATGISPSLRDIVSETGMSLGGVHYALRGLEVRQVIRRLYHKHRAIELIEQPVRYRFIPVSELTWTVEA